MSERSWLWLNVFYGRVWVSPAQSEISELPPMSIFQACKTLWGASQRLEQKQGPVQPCLQPLPS